MSEAGDARSFLDRWSQRKRQAKLGDAQAPEPGPAALEPAALEPAPPLPPIDSLGADSDYTAFLRAGVAHELRALALRRAWASDPAIASFRGMAEYDWDFNVPGYGWLRPADDVAALARRVFGERPPVEPAYVAEAKPTPPLALADERAVEAEVQPTTGDPAPPSEPDAEPIVAAAAPEAPAAATPARRHGGALPR